MGDNGYVATLHSGLFMKPHPFNVDNCVPGVELRSAEKNPPSLFSFENKLEGYFLVDRLDYAYGQR